MTTKPKFAQQKRLAKVMRKRGWSYKTPSNGIRRRLYDLTIERHPWWDWGHRLMILTGTDMGGNWDAPSPPTWWYRQGPARPMARTGYPRHPLSTYEIVTDYDEFRRRTEGLNEDQMYSWRAICVDSDGQLQLGHRYWGGSFYGLERGDVDVLRRYLRMWRRHDWFGARSWLYAQGLHGAVHRRKPGACQAVPPKGSGGYDHWHCTKRRGHQGIHRFNNYVWGDVGGEQLPATFQPEAS